MPARSTFAELYAYNDWANAKVLQMADGLSDAQLDASREMGFGSLRATLHHILAAEQVWLGRWQGQPWAPLDIDPQAISLGDLAAALRDTSQRRAALIANEEGSGFCRIVHYADSQGNAYAHPIGHLLLHVANHGIYHRSQALHFLKSFGRTVPAGIDYLFYKLALPDIHQEPECTAALRGYGLEVATGNGEEVRFEQEWVRRYFAYGDWAMTTVLESASELTDAALDHDFNMGIGSLRRNLLHIYDAERWWFRNWTEGTRAFERLPTTIGLAELRDKWSIASSQRGQFLAELDREQARRIVQVQVGGPLMQFRVAESLLQLCGHGTHHRAQIVNMLRQSQVAPPRIDYIVWVRDHAPSE